MLEVPGGGRILVGVSGGADSLALLLALVVLRDRREGVSPVAVYVDHSLRAAAADEAARVGEVCARWGVPFHRRAIHPGTLPGNVLANARVLRYQALRELARAEGIGFIATGHHADDQFETLLMSLMRSTRWTTPRGMRERQPWKDVVLLRPLLKCRRRDIENFCRAAETAWVDDPSNRDPRRERARLRAELMPVIESIWPNAVATIAELAASLPFVQELLRAHVRSRFGSSPGAGWSRAELRMEPPEVLTLGLHHLLREQAGPVGDSFDAVSLPSARLVRQAVRAIRDDNPHPRRFEQPGRWVLEVTADRVRLHRIGSEQEPPASCPSESRYHQP